MNASCGELIASVQKDGWSYAVDAATGSCNWQFPPISPPITDPPACKWTGYSKFDSSGMSHDPNAYRAPGAAWNDAFIVRTGGENLVPDGPMKGYARLHALNACATTEKERVRWISVVPHSSGNQTSLSAPSVAGGIVFVATDQGHLVVLADPSIVPPVEHVCSNPDYSLLAPPGDRSLCVLTGFVGVPVPQVLNDIALPDSGNIAYLRKEPAIAYGAVFVGTTYFATGVLGTNVPAGHVYKLAP